MTIKFWCTVSDRAGRAIERSAKHDGINRTTKAGQLLESAAQDRLRSGEYPEEWGDEKGSADHEIEGRAIALIKALLEGKEPDPGLVAAIARELDISPHELAKLKKENGHAAKSAR